MRQHDAVLNFLCFTVWEAFLCFLAALFSVSICYSLPTKGWWKTIVKTFHILHDGWQFAMLYIVRRKGIFILEKESLYFFEKDSSHYKKCLKIYVLHGILISVEKVRCHK